MIFSRGVGYMTLAVFLFSTMVALVKTVKYIPSVEVVFFRSFISLTASWAMLRAQGVSPWGKRKGYLLGRGLSGAVALTLYYEALRHIPLASATILQFTAPIFTSLIGIYFVREKMYAMQWVFFGMAFAGVFLVEGFDPRVEPLYAGLGLVAVLMSALAHNFIRKLNTTEHPLVIIFYFPLITTPLSGLYCLFYWVPPQGWDWLILIGIGVLTQMAQFFMTKAIQIEELSRISIIRYSGIFYALGYGYLLFGETFDFLSYLGMAVALGAILLNLWYKNRMHRKERAAEAAAASAVHG